MNQTQQMPRPDPKPIPKQRRTFGYDYWTKVRKKSAEKKKMKLQPIQQKDEKFYAYLWKTRKHECENCGNKLSEPKKHNFHHILPKSTHPYFRWEEKNILIVDWSCHQKMESAVSYPKQPAYQKCEKIKRELLSNVGIEYISH